MTPEITPADLERLQVDAGLPNPPTELTYSCRMAVSGEGELAPTWEDKPHRLVYDLCAHIERIAAEQRAQEAEPARYYAKLPDTVHCEIVEQVRNIRAFRIDLSDDDINVVAEAVYNALTDTGAHPPRADDDLTAAYLAGAASRNGEVRALQAEADRLREALREARGGVADWTMSYLKRRDLLDRIDAILAGEG